MMDPSSPSETLPQESPPNSPKKSKSYFTLPLIAILLLLSIYLLFSKSASPSLQINEEIPLNETILLSVNLSSDTIQANSETISMVVSLETKNFKPPAREPIDLVCMVDFPGARHKNNFESVQSSLKKILPLMSDQDRLSVIIFDEELSTG